VNGWQTRGSGADPGLAAPGSGRAPVYPGLAVPLVNFTLALAVRLPRAIEMMT
jgi:hypothetical protein